MSFWAIFNIERTDDGGLCHELADIVEADDDLDDEIGICALLGPIHGGISLPGSYPEFPGIEVVAEEIPEDLYEEISEPRIFWKMNQILQYALTSPEYVSKYPDRRVYRFHVFYDVSELERAIREKSGEAET